MMLKIGRLKLKHDVEIDNRNKTINLGRKLRFHVARVLKVSPEHKLVTIVYDALTKGVKEFKTTDKVLLNMSVKIENELRMKVINAAKG